MSQDYFPEKMMSRPELKRAGRLVANLDRALMARIGTTGVDGSDRALRDRWHQDLTDLSAGVWERVVGLEVYSVVHIDRGDYQCRFQMLEIELMRLGGGAQGWSWTLNGRLLRRDGTLGSKSGGIGFRSADIQRRHLDGIWRELEAL